MTKPHRASTGTPPTLSIHQARSTAIALFCLLALLALVPGLVVASAQQKAGTAPTEPPTSVSWQPLGEATAQWLGWIDLYRAKLWVGPKTNAQNLLADHTALKLELCYLRALTPDDFIQAAESGLPDDLPPAQRAAVDRLHNHYQRVQPDDCYQLVYQPDSGLKLKYNQNTVLTDTTPGFKATYLGLWLGSNALAPEVKDALLAPLEGTQPQTAPTSNPATP